MDKKWLQAAGIRAIRTAAQTASSMLAVGVAASEVDWGKLVSVSLVAAIFSLLTSLKGLPELKDGGTDGSK